MARTTGPILAIGAITVAADVLPGGELDMRVPVATGIAAGLFALVERTWEDGAVALAYVALVTILLVRVQPGRPSPTERILQWWQAGDQPTAGRVVRA
jgi:hypothetical protein